MRGHTRLGVRVLGRAIGFRVPMCLSRFLLGLEASARAQLRDRISRDDVLESSPVRDCKYDKYVRYISTYKHTLVTTT